MRIFVLALLTNLVAWPAISAEPGWRAEDIDSAEVNAAAQAAFDALGPDRGAIALLAGFDGGRIYAEGLDTGAIALVAGFDGGEIYFEGSDTGGIEIIGLGQDTTGVPLGLMGLVSDLDADVTAYGYKISLSGDVLFEFDKADIKPEAKETLQKVVELAKKENAVGIRVEGHTDSKGSDDYNLELSKRRAESVKMWLVILGKIDANIIESVGLGETVPTAENTHSDGSDNPDGRTQNRRVDIYVKKPT